MVNSADPDQLASSEANWSGSALFAKAVYIQVQQEGLIQMLLHENVYYIDWFKKKNEYFHFFRP